MAKATRAFMLIGVLLGSVVVAPAGDHLVSTAQVEEHLREAAAGDSARVAPPVPAIQALSAEEREDLASRAARLDTDPAATGAGHFVAGMLVGAAITVVVIIYAVVSDPNY